MKKFNESRSDLKPYGFTCELWKSHLMRRPDRHNEIEINFLLDGSLTYLIHNMKIKTEKGKVLIFWALLPHQIVEFDEVSPYYVVTIPINFLSSWNLSNSFIDRLLRGEVQMMEIDDVSKIENMFQSWEKDLNQGLTELREVCIVEIQAFLKRLIYHNKDNIELTSDNLNLSVVEKMALYIAANFTKGIRVNDVALHVNLHPDYANQIFKNAFGVTISSYLMEQKVLFAQRQLTASNKPITSIAYEAGFNSISRFNATFKGINKVTPREYRINSKATQTD